MEQATPKKVGLIGSGTVAQTLGAGFKKKGWEPMLGTREPAKLAKWAQQVGGAVGAPEEAASFGDVVVLAVKGTAAEKVVKGLAPRLAGKLVLDATNPIADDVPAHGVLRFFTGPGESLMERLQNAAPTARFVKAFNCIGAPFMVDPSFPGGKPSMFLCGNDDKARAEAAELVQAFGFEVEDMGRAEAARAIEPLAMLWCIPGFLRDEWGHAFKLLKAKG